MKKQTITNKVFPVLLAATVLFSSCASTTLIRSTPSGARVYMNEEPVGTTPYRYTDTKIIGSTTVIRLEKEGYKPVETTLTRNEQLDAGALIGGLFFAIPFLWIMEYKPAHSYELKPVTLQEESVVQPETGNNTSK